MKKANLAAIKADNWRSPGGKFGAWGKTLNPAAGAPDAEASIAKWPFEVELSGIAPGKTYGPYHCHAAQWEFYLVVSGVLTVRHEGGESEAKPGDFFMFGPGEYHQLSNRSDSEVTYYCIADNPVTDHCYFPDSKKWLVRLPKSGAIRGEKVDYFLDEDVGGGSWILD